MDALKYATFRRNQLRGYKATVTKHFLRENMTVSERDESNKEIDNVRRILNEYIFYLTKKLAKKGRGFKQRGGSVIFFNDPKQLIKKLELIIGEVIAGNTSIEMRNMGVSILDKLLKIATINRSQYNKIYNNYFKI